MQLIETIEFTHQRCFTCGSWWAIEKDRYFPLCQCPRCASHKIEAAVDQAEAAVRSARASRANATRAIRKTKKT